MPLSCAVCVRNRVCGRDQVSTERVCAYRMPETVAMNDLFASETVGLEAYAGSARRHHEHVVPVACLEIVSVGVCWVRGELEVVYVDMESMVV